MIRLQLTMKDNIYFVTLKIGDFCFDIPVSVISESKAFNIECATDIDKIKGGSE